jgi:hypothetical protein
MTKGAGKLKRDRVAMRETEPEREENLGRRGMRYWQCGGWYGKKHKVEYTREEGKVEMFTH